MNILEKRIFNTCIIHIKHIKLMNINVVNYK